MEIKYVMLTTIIPLILILTGIITYKFKPKKINAFYGFRSIYSRKNQRLWDFANKRFPVWLMIEFSVILFLSVGLLFIVKDKGKTTIITMFLQTMYLFFLMTKMEIKLYRSYKNGTELKDIFQLKPKINKHEKENEDTKE